MTQPWLEKILALRVHQPDAVAAAAGRRHRIDIASRGRLLIVAADHAARGALGSGRDPMAMGSRVDLIERLRAALANPGVHGVLGTADVLEDLLLLGALEGKLVFGSMNRGGLAGSTFEMDDRFTGFDAAAIEDRDFDGGKMLLRIDPEDPATARTLEGCARAVDQLAARKLVALIEPFWSGRILGRVRNDLSPDAMIRAIAVASGLGSTSAYTWLKVPVVDEMERVMEASTLPALLLGGEAEDDQDAVFERWRKALALPTVRGLVVGRNLLYPPDGDVVGAVESVVGLL